MTTMITGAGMIGSLVAARIVRERAERPLLFDLAFSMENLRERFDPAAVELVKGDVTDVGHLIETMRGYDVDRVIHTASLLTRDLIPRPYAGVRVNLMGTLSALEAARIVGVERFVFCSSTVVTMGRRSVDPSGLTPADFSLSVVSEHPPSLYASMKLAAEWLCHCYSNDYGVDAAAVRFGGVFGPWHGVPGGGPSKLLKSLIECAHFGSEYQIAAPDLDRQGMDYTYSPDAAQAAVRAAHAAAVPSRVYSATMGTLHTIRDVIELIEQVSGRPLNVEVVDQDSMTKYGNPTSPMDLSRSTAELGYEVEYPMERAIEDYLRWLGQTSPRR
jgi:UDP-glucose 4-epimerase